MVLPNSFLTQKSSKMKKIVSILALLFSASSIFAQTTATNWTATDCDGTSHTLFNELDSGKVVVFVWVMPCSSCIAPAKTAYNAVQSFATSNPGIVRYYLADDLGDATCTSLNSWVTSNSIGSVSNMKIFSNSGIPIDEADFGGTGMPHIVVIGGPSHTIHFNKKNSSSNDLSGITSAITAAIGTTGVREANAVARFSVAPNPAISNVVVSGPTAISVVEILTPDGKVVSRTTLAAPVTSAKADCSRLASGLYLVRVTDVNGLTGIQKFEKL